MKTTSTKGGDRLGEINASRELAHQVYFYLYDHFQVTLIENCFIPFSNDIMHYAAHLLYNK